LECYEFTQFPGETVYVPHGWWHAVLNITHTVGVTQNYCSRRNFDDVWRATRCGRKKMACKWLHRLGEVHPDLARRARLLNDADGHVMWEDDPEEQRRWKKKREERDRRRREREREDGKVREEEKEEEDDDDDVEGEERRKKSSTLKREKWGEHRTIERRASSG
jgi:histone arginine demethylase JMJD6